jgi:hypothetical protein
VTRAGAAELWDAFCSALDEVGAASVLRRDERGDTSWDAIGRVEGVPVVVATKAVPTVGDVLALARRDRGDAYVVLVARRVSRDVATSLVEHDMGFFDARGRLRLWRRPLLIDTTVAGGELAPAAGARRLCFDTASLLDVALGVLDGVARGGVRATAALLGRSPGTVSKQLAALRGAGLVDTEGDPAVPDLFEAVAESWRPVRVPLAGRPGPAGGGRVNERLQLGFDDPDGPGWVLADVAAAAGWGAPIVLTDESPPDFYVPDQRVVAQARSLLGVSEFGRHACTVALAPAPFVCRRRHDRSTQVDNAYLLPSPVVAALDLAVDPARGREMLELWSRDLPPEVRRVW